MFGWHVHEKAILHVLVPMILLLQPSASTSATPPPSRRSAASAEEDNCPRLYRKNARDYSIVSIAGCYALLPLLFRQDEYLLKAVVFVMNTLYIMLYSDLGSSLSPFEDGYVLGFALLELIKVFLLSPPASIAPALPALASGLPFLPLLLTSLYAFVGIAYVWAHQCLYYVSLIQPTRPKAD